MRYILVAAVAVFIGGCVPLQVAETTASLTLPSGLIATYHSTKDQQGVEVYIEERDPEDDTLIKKWRLVVEKSGTPEAAFKAMAERDKVTAETIKALVSRLMALSPPTF